MKQLGEVPNGDVQHECAALHAEAKVDQGLEGQGGNMGFSPLTLLCIQIFLILDPPGQCHVLFLKWHPIMIDVRRNMKLPNQVLCY